MNKSGAVELSIQFNTTNLTILRQLYLRNKETQQTLRVIVSIQYDARYKCK